MAEYLREIQYAATETLRLVWHEYQQLTELERKISGFSLEIEGSNRRLEWLYANPEFDDDHLSTYIHWESYFGPQKNKSLAEVQVSDVKRSILSKQFSTDVQAANLLQYGKQALSFTHGGKTACPEGRVVFGGVHLRDLVWEGRNQAQHWEEMNPKAGVRQCFDALAAADSRFVQYSARNMAFEVVRLLGWREYADYERDMMTLA